MLLSRKSLRCAIHKSDTDVSPNFFIPNYASDSGRHDERQGNVNSLHRLDLLSGANTK